MVKPTIYIIGAGISGLACATYLSEKGYRIKLYESARQAGGRLRSFYDDKLKATIDNGNHLILGANSSAINLISNINALENFHKVSNGKFNFFNSESKSGFETDKFNLSTIPGIKAVDYIKLAFMAFPMEKTVAQIFGPSSALFNNYIDHISRSLLNTSSYNASAKLLRDVMLKIVTSKNGFDYYFPKTNWQEALIEPLLKNANANIQYNRTLKRINFSNGFAIELIFAEGSEIITENDFVILATPPRVAANLIDGLQVPQQYNPILNIHFQLAYDLPAQIFALLNSPVEWVFVKPGIISTTTSAAGDNILDMPEDELARKAWADIAEYLNLKKVKLPPYRIITEKRATISADAASLKLRPANRTRCRNLLLSGDYTSSKLSATIESAIQSAEKCVDIISSK